MTAPAGRPALDHPVIDSDGHTVEFMPVWLEVAERLAGRRARERFETLVHRLATGWYELSPEARLAARAPRPPWWATPTENTRDRATASLPRLLHERLGEFGIDFSVLYPSTGLLLFALEDAELRQLACRSLNAMNAELYAPYSDRLTPVAVVPMHTPDEAIAELDHAVGELGLKAALLAGHVRRPGADGGPAWLDTLGVDSAHDYDPVWARCAELGIAPTFHSSAAGWEAHRSPSNYVYNHLGQFAAAGEATCRSLFLNGVTRRFPGLRFAFLEGGAGWGCTLYADLLGHWEKRNRAHVRRYDPERLDEELLRELFERYAEPLHRGRLDRLAGTLGLHATPEDPSMLDEFERCGVDGPEDLRELFVPRFFFGCEADDPLTAWAFRADVNPLGARLRAIFGSDLGHWDVPEMSEIPREAYEPVERGRMSADDFRDFVFTHPVELWTAGNPDFFAGTAVETAVSALTAQPSS